jgi:hydroxyethylthiazole kinase-like uncharacterized protein yjeF
MDGNSEKNNKEVKMQNIYNEVNSLDTRCCKKFDLTEDILMENASISMMNHIIKTCKKKDKILIVSGAGNNGADGIVLARLLHTKYKVSLYLPHGIKSDMAVKQLQRAQKIKVKISTKITKADVVVDCLFGSGLNRDLDKKSVSIIKKMNKINCYKIACDVPSGINYLGQVSKRAFYADITITMGALKRSLFTDIAKEYVGKIKVSDLGIQRKLYETKTNCFLLEKKDLKLPIRDNKISNKGTFGHLSVVIGNKAGAGLLCADAGFSFGCGLITIISKELKRIPNYIMQSKIIPTNTTALCLGMGLGNIYDKNLLENGIPKVIDADLFYDENLLNLLEQKNIVITPHPKEFCSLLKMTNLANVNVEELQNDRFKYVDVFSKRYKNVVLLLKGTNVIISQNQKRYVNTLGSSILSKGGSGDVLCGLIGSLLAQGYSTLDAAINGSLAHTMASANYTQNNYSMTPQDLIKEIKKL